MNIFSKLKFLLRKPKVIVIAGEGRVCAKEAIFQVLNRYFKIDKEIFIFQIDDLKKEKKFEFLIKNSSLPVLVITRVGDIPFAQDFFAPLKVNKSGQKGKESKPLTAFAREKEKIEEIVKLAKILPTHGHLILNFDDETVREIKDETNLNEITHAPEGYKPSVRGSAQRSFTFGFGERADFRVSDIKLNSGTNFKLNFEGKVIPIWLEKLFGIEQIYSALAAAAVGTIFGLNLIKISQALKDYRSLPGKMRLVEGIKNSKILDDSESTTVFSMLEALDILGKIPNFKRRIAVLGDVLGIGKYTLQAHEVIGEKAKNCLDSLFIFGQRAKFIGKGAFEKGLPLEKIFQFDTIEAGISKLKDEIREGDLVLIDGSKELEMGKIVEEIKK